MFYNIKVYQINPLYTLNLHKIIYQLYILINGPPPQKKRKKKSQASELLHTLKKKNCFKYAHSAKGTHGQKTEENQEHSIWKKNENIDNEIKKYRTYLNITSGTIKYNNWIEKFTRHIQ